VDALRAGPIAVAGGQARQIFAVMRLHQRPDHARPASAGTLRTLPVRSAAARNLHPRTFRMTAGSSWSGLHPESARSVLCCYPEISRSFRMLAMRPTPLQEQLHTDFARLVGCRLNMIKIGLFHIDFVLLGDDILLTLRMKNGFHFTLTGEEELSFDPTSTVHDETTESTRFVLLHNLQCTDIQIDEYYFNVSFENAKLWMTHTEKDFEPFELIGSTGDNFENLAFYHVT
jgi:hypothetical protein